MMGVSKQFELAFAVYIGQEQVMRAPVGPRVKDKALPGLRHTLPGAEGDQLPALSSAVRLLDGAENPKPPPLLKSPMVKPTSNEPSATRPRS